MSAVPVRLGGYLEVNSASLGERSRHGTSVLLWVVTTAKSQIRNARGSDGIELR
jgi:hypothetical protein